MKPEWHFRVMSKIEMNVDQTWRRFSKRSENVASEVWRFII